MATRGDVEVFGCRRGLSLRPARDLNPLSDGERILGVDKVLDIDVRSQRPKRTRRLTVSEVSRRSARTFCSAGRRRLTGGDASAMFTGFVQQAF